MRLNATLKHVELLLANEAHSTIWPVVVDERTIRRGAY